MPDESAQTEMPAEKTMRRWYEGKLAERIGQFAQMAKDRSVMRRGAVKMQNGTLGVADPTDPEVEDMNIRIGDEIHNHPAASPSTPSTVETPAKQPGALLSGAGLIGLAVLVGLAVGYGSAFLEGRILDKPEPPPAVVGTDTDTTRRIDIEVRHTGEQATDSGLKGTE